jgi:hypothetical protein
LRHVPVDRHKEVAIGLVAASAQNFAVLDSAELVVLFPQIGLEDLDGRKKTKNIRVSVRQPVVVEIGSRR